ncbi:MAG TPA: hypothetical protein VFH39_04805, partial [Candidatus Saccharimonadales bacterium]|nr:hypothetical protein [Candidatus Saccharimonadales bacterium]
MSEATVPVRVERPAPHQDYPAALTIVALMFVGTLVSLLWFLHTPSNYQERFNLSFALHGSLSVITGGSPDNPMPLYYW